MRPLQLIVIVAIVGMLCSGTVLASDTPLAGTFNGCAVNGVGGDTGLNVLKNRAAQVGSPESISVTQINALPVPAGVIRVDRAGWPQAATRQVSPFEQKGAVVTGFLKGVRQEGPEATNCGSSSSVLRDYHVWLVDSVADGRDKSIVVEVTPRWRASNPGWKLSTLMHFVDQGSKVRITGWLLLDQEHPEQVHNTRGGLWEIHPITKIELFSGGKWVEL